MSGHFTKAGGSIHYELRLDPTYIVKVKLAQCIARSIAEMALSQRDAVDVLPTSQSKLSFVYYGTLDDISQAKLKEWLRVLAHENLTSALKRSISILVYCVIIAAFGVTFPVPVKASVLFQQAVETLQPVKNGMTSVVADEVPQVPYLSSIGVGLRGYAVDRRGRWLGVEHGVVDLWSIATGEKVQTLRPPQGPGTTGSLHGLAFSPDGNLVAVGWRSDSTASILIFDRTTGRIVKTFQNLANVVSDIRFSPDGGLLAASLMAGGVELFDVRTGAEIGRDLNFGGASFTVDFSSTGGLLVLPSLDGFLHIYQASRSGLRLLGQGRARAFSDNPISARFSPAGDVITVTFDQLNTVYLYAVNNLNKVGELTAPLLSSNFPDSAWSDTSDKLSVVYMDTKNRSRVRQWLGARPDAFTSSLINTLSKSRTIDVDGHGSINGIAALPNGAALVVTSTLAWGVISPDGQVAWRESRDNGGRMAEHLIDTKNPVPILLSDDARKIAFFAGGNKPEVIFDITRREFLATDASVHPAKIAAAGLKINIAGTSMNGFLHMNARPTVNGKPLEIEPYEYPTGLAIARDGGKFAMSTTAGIRMYSTDGTVLWRAGFAAYAINLSKDGQWLVEDGGNVIRWLCVSDGKLLLSFLPNLATKQWVLWTPSGYYDSSADGDALVGWAVNHGLTQASDFYPLSQFADAMRRPDIVDRVLQTTDESQALEMANKAAGRPTLTTQQMLARLNLGAKLSAGLMVSALSAKPNGGDVGLTRDYEVNGLVTPDVVARLLPPTIQAIDIPQTFSSDRVTIRFKVSAPANAPFAGEPRVLVNGRWQPRSRAVSQLTADVRTVVVTDLPPQDSIVNIYVDNNNGPSAPLVVPLKWVGSAQPPRDKRTAAVRKPKLFILAVGISQYARADLQLTFADRDAEQIISAMTTQQGKAYSSVSTRLIMNQNATRLAVLAGLNWLKSQVAADDVGLLFLSGHGLQTSDGFYFFAPADFDPARPRDTGVKYIQIRDALVGFESKGNRAVFLIDTCYSGGVLGENAISSSGETFARTLGRGQNSMVGMTSSSGHQVSLEKVEWGDGAFTKALLEGIVEARADAAQTGEITMLGLGSYVSQRVRSLTGQAQTPIFISPEVGLQDFSIALH
jgi:WD40 repeat protein/predicted XRE-type DNA-binding protein